MWRTTRLALIAGAVWSAYVAVEMLDRSSVGSSLLAVLFALLSVAQFRLAGSR